MSNLTQYLQEYLALRRALGFKLQLSGCLLQKFVQFAQQQGTAFISHDLAVRWAAQPPKAQLAQWANRLGMVRRFAQYCSGVDPRTEIPPPGLLPHRFQRKPPHFYSDLDAAPVGPANRTARLGINQPLLPGCCLTLRRSCALPGQGPERALHAAAPGYRERLAVMAA